MREHSSGPFTFTPVRAVKMGGVRSTLWEMHYGGLWLGALTLLDSATPDAVCDAFGVLRGKFVIAAREEHAADRVDLIDFESGDAVAFFMTHGVPDMTPGLIDDRSRYWLRSADRRRSRPVTLSEFAAIAAAHQAPALSWVAGLLPDDVLSENPEDWRPPTSWELRHIVGEGSFTGLSGAKAAALVGVTPQNFRKYTAGDGAKTRQHMSFAMWHLLLHRLKVKALQNEN